jgi:hypothetical protein
MRNPQHPLGRREAIIAGCGAMATLLAACASTPASTGTAVDLKYTKEGRLTGTFAGRRVDLSSKLPGAPGTASGTVAGDAFNASWQITYDGTDSQRVVPVRLHGSLAAQAVSLNAIFRLKPNYLFDSGPVTGTSGGRPVHAQASSAPGESSSSVNVNGTFAGTPFSLYATLAGDLTNGLIRGTVNGKRAHWSAQAKSGGIHITGDYTGPSELFVLATGSLLYFLGGTYAA